MGNDSLISRCFSTVMYIVKLVVLHIAKWCSPTSFPDKFLGWSREGATDRAGDGV